MLLIKIGDKLEVEGCVHAFKRSAETKHVKLKALPLQATVPQVGFQFRVVLIKSWYQQDVELCVLLSSTHTAVQSLLQAPKKAYIEPMDKRAGWTHTGAHANNFHTSNQWAD